MSAARRSAATSACSAPRLAENAGLMMCVDGTDAFGQNQVPATFASANFGCVPARENRAGSLRSHQRSGSSCRLLIRNAIASSSASSSAVAAGCGNSGAGRSTSPPATSPPTSSRRSNVLVERAPVTRRIQSRASGRSGRRLSRNRPGARSEILPSRGRDSDTGVSGAASS
ncbi:hypothetical protein BIV01_09120 [Curtobacterium sp. MCBA15_013]|nr:hypothetical protein BIV03_08920 [Curtobacterium sp. MCBA15_016]OII26928.1 hypothetical protein BIV01_09120 [Curtobacterium sp. MCBA15_013]